MKIKAFFAIFLLIISLSSCNANSDATGNSQTPDGQTQYFDVTYDSGVANISIDPQTVEYMQRASKPALPQVEGYTFIGWRKSDAPEGEMWNFAKKITEDTSLVAVWRKDEDNFIYGEYSYLYFVHAGGVDKTLASEFKEAVSDTAYTATELISDGASEKMYHEIAVGRTRREISNKAYSELEKISSENTICALIYSDGSSIALAYSETESDVAIGWLRKYFLSNLVTEHLTLDPGIVYSFSCSVNEYYENLDEQNRVEQWERLSLQLTERVGDEKAEKIISELKELYAIYKPEMVEWYARLYDPKYGGYYYSNSARDNETVTYQGVTYPLLPDVESTNQALNFLISSGMTHNYAKDLPSFMREQIVAFVRSLQDPNGYFYHPQWPKELTNAHTSRRSRDLGWSENILKKFGALPIYDTPGTMKGEGKAVSYLTLPLSHSAVYAVSLVTPTSVNTNITDKTSFVSYLEGFVTSETRNIHNHSYSIGNELTSQTNEILKRDEELRAAGENYSLMSILIDWLNLYQNEETGHWHHTSNYYGVNGLLKISGIYNSAKVPMPNAYTAAKSAMAAITSDEKMGAVVDLYNTWFAVGNIVTNLRNYGTDDDEKVADDIVLELMLKSDEAIKKSKEKISAFQKPDGSFSYCPTTTSSTSQGMPVAISGTNEGDVNATGISSTGLIGYMFKALELGGYKPSLFGYKEFRRYVDILEESNLEFQKKQPASLTNYKPIDFEDSTSFDRISTTLVSDGAEVQTNKTDDNTTVSFITNAGGNDSLYVSPETKETYNAVLFYADISVSDVFNSSTVFQIMFDSAKDRAYMMALGFDGEYVTVSDVSSTSDASSRREQTFVSDIEAGETFNLGVEYYSTEDGVRIKIFINKNLVYVSDNYYNSHKDTSPTTTEIVKMRFYSLNSASATLTVDNIVFAQDNLEYCGLDVGKQ